MNEQLAKLPDVGTGYDETQELTPMELIRITLTQPEKADLVQLERLMGLQERWEANKARRAFVEAMNAFKTNPPEILKTKPVAFGTGDKAVAYKYATLANVCEQVTGALSEHGISHRWRTEQSDGLIRVTCILTHKLGHSEETTLSAGLDQTGSKNPIQALGSSVKYLMRYTLLAATGLEAGDGDDDGQNACPPMETLQVHLDRIKGSENTQQLTNAFRDAFAEATKLNNVKAGQAIMKAKDETKARLQKAAEPAQ